MRSTTSNLRSTPILFLLLAAYCLLLTLAGCGDPFARGEAVEALSGGGGTAGGSMGGSGGDTGGGAGGKEYSYTADVYPVFKSKCTACHSSAGPGAFKLSGDPAADYAGIKTLVNTGSPADSTLLVKGTTPMMGLAAGSAEYETIKGWITQGAAQ